MYFSHHLSLSPNEDETKISVLLRKMGEGKSMGMSN